MKHALFLILLLLTGMYGVAVQAIEDDATSTPDHIVLTWTADPATTQTITWRTDATVSIGQVQYRRGNALGGTPSAVPAAMSIFTTDLAETRLFTATLSNLEPDRQYTYRVGDGTHWSAPLTFRTAPRDTDHFKFLVFGDSQSGDEDHPIYAPWHVTVTRAFAAYPSARFMINVGDLVETGQHGADWNGWFAAAAGVIDRIPAMAVPGNHENALFHSDDSVKPSDWIAQFPLPQNGPALLGNEVYSYDYGNVHFVVLDSQQNEEKPTMGDILEIQKAWLAADLAASTATWKVVLFHQTPYGSRIARPNEEVRKALCPIIEKYHADVVFTGHDHAVARTYPLRDDTIMARPSQGTIYYTVGRSGNKAYGDITKKYWHAYQYDPQDQPNYLVVSVDGKRLAIDTVKQDGTLVDSFVIDKPRDSTTDTARHPSPTTTWYKYSKPVLAIDGNLVPTTMVTHAPMKKDGHWYVDARAVAAFFGGTLAHTGTTTSVTIDKQATPIAARNVLIDKEVVMVATEALAPCGFTADFHPEINVLNLTK